ncbi:hypothetical protein KGD82_16770 [Nocardiopsis eucommiae]|uniref:Uncharacterized protein n=1 Tax=Nocardiopsis eucommiae TaxID=2831970 RepID=A0A975QJL1_9ACTN|nr:hypothetical protein KGD82_16770 [Nocardiopsis eucommiae]
MDAACAHLAYLAKREAAGRLYRSANEQQYQDRAEYWLNRLEEAVAEDRPETPADRVAAEQPAKYDGDWGCSPTRGAPSWAPAPRWRPRPPRSAPRTTATGPS